MAKADGFDLVASAGILDPFLVDPVKVFLESSIRFIHAGMVFISVDNAFIPKRYVA
jgi:hypothetical protein